ncbi:hypothetical protein HNP73_000461 [Amaricoccus macauensis]|uniref:Acyloxyacyl hydrolase n=1 Tax=Amaricoccus macauensis TaxID=57001 RepID=A0A840SIE7_9RHOB|nr:hypothetical protein [Amaricoccus macauensis]MBB5220540.1 hypothetical protein [Amaricoccus macauensis]
MTKATPISAALLLAAVSLSPAVAGSPAPETEDNAFVFTGRLLDEDMGDSLKIISGDYEDNFITGIGAQDFAIHTGIVSLGYELGAAARYGQDSTFEAWGGLVGRIDDIRLLDWLYVSPALVFGLSYVSDSHEGREKRLEAQAEGDARMLFYLSPELDFRRSPDARYSVFYRLHHRSGAWNTLGMHGGSNANIFGVRMRF